MTKVVDERGVKLGLNLQVTLSDIYLEWCG